MKKIKLFLCFALFMILTAVSASAATRIKDIARVDGVRENQLYGYGLVLGLSGTGDRQGSAYTLQAVGNMLRRLGVNVPPAEVADQIRSRNIAAVIVTAELPPFVRSGSRIDVVVSSIGDASNLSGGMLLQTPLQAANGNIYAVAQGQILTGLSAGARTATRGPLTVARIPNGAMVEKEVPSTMVKNGALSIILNNPDFSTSQRIVEVINQGLKVSAASAADAGTIIVEIPQEYGGNIVGLISRIEQFTVTPDAIARVVINERTGTVVAGKEVRVSTVAVTHGDISLQIRSTKDVTVSTAQVERHPPKGELVSSTDSTTMTGEGTREMMVLDEGTNIYELVKALNALGVSPKDLIAILQAVKEAGALQAELVVI